MSEEPSAHIIDSRLFRDLYGTAAMRALFSDRATLRQFVVFFPVYFVHRIAGHMLSGIAGLDREGWSADDFRVMEELVTEQLRQRIRMRNAEFSFPLSEDRVQAIYAGDIAPEPFDFKAAEARLMAHAAE